MRTRVGKWADCVLTILVSLSTKGWTVAGLTTIEVDLVDMSNALMAAVLGRRS